MKVSKKKKALFLGVVLTLALGLLAGCHEKPLPDGMDKEATLARGQEIMELLMDGEYQTVADSFRPDMKEKFDVTEDVIRGVMEPTTDAGEFVEVSESTTSAGKSKEFDEPYGLAIFYCEYEEDDIVYQISMDANLDLIGLGVKKK